MVKHSIVCCLLVLIVAVNAKFIDDVKAEINELDKQLIEKINRLDTLERQKLDMEENKEDAEFRRLLDSIEHHADKRIKRQTYQSTPVAAAPAYSAPAVAAAPAAPAYGGSFDASSMMMQQPALGAGFDASSFAASGAAMDPSLMLQMQQQQQFGMMQQQPMFAARSALGVMPTTAQTSLGAFPTTSPMMASPLLGTPALSTFSAGATPFVATTPLVAATPAVGSVGRLPIGLGMPAHERFRLSAFPNTGIRKLAFTNADPVLNANGNPLPNTCAKGVSEPIYEGFSITESYCRCPDLSYGFTCGEGFGNPCAGNEQQFFNADTRIPNNYFVHCSNQMPYLKKCPTGLVWDQEITTCNWPPQPVTGGAPAYGGAAAPIIAPQAAPAYTAPAAAPAYSAPVAPAIAPAAPSYGPVIAPAAAPYGRK